MDLTKIYKSLYKYFGPQGWWPVRQGRTTIDNLQLTIDRNARPLDAEKFEICVGAILTQNTTWKNTEKALTNLIIARVTTPQKILQCPSAKLCKLIRSAGYFRQKCKKLKIFSKFLVENYNGDLKKFFGGQLSNVKGLPRTKSKISTGTNYKGSQRRHPQEYRVDNETVFRTSVRGQLLLLWGIGPETADSILLYAGGQPSFVIDSYTRRLCECFGAHFKTYYEYKNFFESQLPRNTKLFNEYHALIVAWGKLYSKNKALALQIIGLLDD